MIRDITIGQYYPTTSKIHTLDARLKLVATFLFIFSIFMVHSFTGYFYIVLSLGLVILQSKVPLKYMLKGIKSIMVIIVFTAILNIFMYHGETILFQFSFVTITLEGLIMAFKMCFRLIILIIGSSVLTLTTTPIQLTDGIEYLLRPLKPIGVPAHEIAMMMTIALRFIPTLLDETDKIMKAQQARGADFESGGLMERAKSLIPILVPLFISAFRRAEELAMAMEARCYHGDSGRTRMKPMQFQKLDYIGIFILVCYTVGIFALRYLEVIYTLI
ncbi:MAG: energy-coupling factor transporter transmembrane component T [Bacillota bacterium]